MWNTAIMISSLDGVKFFKAAMCPATCSFRVSVVKRTFHSPRMESFDGKWLVTAIPLSRDTSILQLGLLAHTVSLIFYPPRN